MTWMHIIEPAPSMRRICAVKGEAALLPSFLAWNYSSMTTKVPVMRYIRINIDPARFFLPPEQSNYTWKGEE
jgi:hypothetical protein